MDQTISGLDIQPIIEEIIECVELNVPENIPKEIGDLPFGEALWPWIAVARGKLKESLNILSPEAVFSMEKWLITQWSECCAPSMTLEMGLAKRQDILIGDTPYARYQNFIHQTFYNPQNLRLFFDEYTQLASFVATFLTLWVEQSVEFLQRLAKELPKLETTFNEGKALGKVISLKTGLGDPHYHGRTVYELTFSSHVSIFYKPKNLGIVKGFNTFVDELNSLGLSPPLKSYKTLSLEDHGWEEKIKHLPCSTQEDVNNYFLRAGMLLCLMYLLKGNDCHFGNIIASGPFPVLIDLETLFGSQLNRFEQEEIGEKSFSHSVLSTGLLPHYLFGENSKRGIDISGLSSLTKQTSPSKVERWENLNTDEMHSIFLYPPLKSELNLVYLNNQLIESHIYVEKIVSGFEQMYTLIKINRESLTQKGKALIEMGQFPVRSVLRATRFYFRLRKQLFSPQVLLSKKLTQEVLDLLPKYLTQQYSKFHSPICEEERSALLRGDIPCFHTLPKSSNLYVGSKLLLENCMETATHSSVLEHLKTMSDEDCKEQISFIRQSFQAQQSKVHSKLERAPPKETGGKTPILTSQEILAHAEKIAETILEHATETDQKSLGWLALEPLSDLEQFVLRPTSDTLYSGRSGIALFFAALYAFSHKNKWKEAAIKSIYGLQSTLAKNPHNRWIAAHGIGGMSGVGGVLYSLLKIGLLLDDSSIIKTAQSLLDSIEEKHILKDTSYDLLGGSAGLLLALLCWHETFHDEKSLNLSEICGNHLIASALNMGDDIVAWKGTGKQPLLGASHGTSGIAYALFKLSQFAKNPKFAKVAKGAIEYDRSHFSKERGNWSDFRSSTKAYPVNWCHGAPGIGLTRLGSLLYFQDEYFLKEIEIAQETTKEHLFSEHSHLCCGSFGRLELFIEAERSQTQHDLKPFILQAASTLCSQMTQSLNAGPMFSPSFMFGSAGVGYTLLRCIDAKHILPQVLLLQT